MIENNGLPSRELEIDRIDNMRHYEPGNLRWATREQNQANRRNTRLPDWDPEEWPYARSVVTRKIRQGLTRDEILDDAWEAVVCKRKNWRGLKLWFDKHEPMIS